MAKLKSSYPYYLAGTPVAANTHLEVLDKYSGKRATRVAFADAATVHKAIAAAHKARGPMAAFPPDAPRRVEHAAPLRRTRREPPWRYASSRQAIKVHAVKSRA